MKIPKEVSEAISDYRDTVSSCEASAWLPARAALESAILAWGEGVREGALKEQAAKVDRLVDLVRLYRGDEDLGALRVEFETVLALAYRPEPTPCPKCGKRGAACWCPDAAWVNAPASEGCADPHCRDGWHAIGCPKRPPSSPCTCKMPIGFGRSFRGFMAPDPNCAFCRPSPRSETTEDR